MTYRGNLEHVRRGWVRGWVADSARPEARLTVVVTLGGRELARQVADQFRQDLADAGIGDGRHAFTVAFGCDRGMADGEALRVYLADADFELPGSPRPYGPIRPFNVFGDDWLALSAQKRPLGMDLTEPECARLAFEALRGVDGPALRVWLTRPLAASDGRPAETALIRCRLPAVAPDMTPHLTAGIAARAPFGRAPVVLRLTSVQNGREIGRQERPAVLDATWFDLSIDVMTTAPVGGHGDWIFEVLTTSADVMNGVEFRNPLFGAADPERKLESPPPETTPFYRATKAGYSESSLLSSINLLNLNSEGKCGLSHGWSIIKGRNGEFDADLARVPWRPTADALVQPRALSRFEIRTNTYYVRFAHPVRGADVARLGSLAAELVLGADCPADCRSGLAVQVFLRIVQSAGTEVVMPLVPRREIRSELTLASGVLDVDSRVLAALKDSRQIQFVIEATGTGALLVGPAWLGDALLAAARPARRSAAADASVREWCYQRFLETTEGVLGPDRQRAPLAVFVLHVPDRSGASPPDAAAASVRSFVRQGARVSLAVMTARTEAEAAVEAVQRELARSLPLRDLMQVGFEIVNDAERAASAFATFLRKCRSDTLTLAVDAGAIARSDLSAALRRAQEDAGEVNYLVFDHDHWASGRRCDPVLKPGLSSHLLLETDYVGPGVAFRAGALCAALEEGAISPVLPFGRRDVLLRLMERGRPGAKIDHVLLHVGDRGPIPKPAEEKAFIESVLARRRANATVRRWGRELTVRYAAAGRPLVSIVILFRDKADYLRRCLESICKRSAYPNYECILVDNASSEEETLRYLHDIGKDPRVKIVPFNRPFNYSAANNVGARAARGEFLIFMNNDTEALSVDWIETLVGVADLPDTGFVGPRLHFDNGAVQHAGVVVGLAGMAGHVLAGQHDVTMPAMLTVHTRDVSAVTGAVMCVKAERYWALGGFDERFLLTGNDVELCLRARRRNLRNVYVGAAQLFHFEKASRESIPVYLRDLQLSIETYEPELSRGDPFWNRLLSRTRVDYLPRGPLEPSGGDIRRQAIEKRMRTMQGRKLGPDAAFLALYDADQATIEANRETNRRFLSGDGASVRTAAFFVPLVSHIYRGGVFTGLRFAAALYRDRGVAPTLVVCSERPPDAAALEGQLRETFPDVSFRIAHLHPLRDSPASLPPADIAVATLWTTAYVMSRYPARGKFYLIQDYEPLFESAGAGYGLIEASYRFGYFPICNSPGVADAVAPYAKTAMLAFEPAVDRTVFFPAPIARSKDRPVRIVFYGRPNNSRNLFGLGVHALIEAKDILRDRIEIVSAGAAFDPKDHGADGKIINLGLLPSIESVAALYRSCDIGLVFMQSKHPSYQPLEYMASGCATVTNINEANQWLLRDRENCLLTQVTLSSVVESLVELVDDAQLRRTVQTNGLETVGKQFWSDIESRVTEFLVDPVGARSQKRNERAAS